MTLSSNLGAMPGTVLGRRDSTLAHPLNEMLDAFCRILVVREYNRKAPTSVGYLQRKLGYSRVQCIALLKYFESLGVGTVVLGRRGHDTRIQWNAAGAYGVLDYVTRPPLSEAA